MVVFCNNVRWNVANSWVIKMRKQNSEHSYKSSWWGYFFSLFEQIKLTIESFINGSYSFGSMLTLRQSEKIITMWEEYSDRLILKFLHKIIQPVFKKIILSNCFHYFHDPRIRKYLEDVVTVAIADGGEVSLPKLAIPKGSSLSPLFGALYLIVGLWTIL